MGDISAEPSMEEILSSIKRIIAEEGDGAQPRARRPQRAPAPVPPEPDEVLELSEPMPSARQVEPAPVARAPGAVAAPVSYAPAAERQPEASVAPEPIVSQAAAAASRGSLDALSRVVVRPDAVPPALPAAAEATLDGVVREMIRPMLRDWLDAHLPDIVEAMVAREIDRITGSR